MKFFAALVSCLLLIAAPPPMATAQPGPAPSPSGTTPSGAGNGIPLGSGDKGVTVLTDANGVYVAVAQPETQEWSVIASMSVSGWDTAAWTENHCISGDGNYLALAFAPASFSNRAELRLGGAAAAVVDLRTGARWLVPARVALAYHSPGCGERLITFVSRTEQADGRLTTQLATVDPQLSRVVSTRSSSAEYTSPLPLSDGTLLAALGERLVRVDPHGDAEVARAPGPIFDLRQGRGRTVEFLARVNDNKSRGYRLTGNSLEQFAEGPLSNLRLFAGTGGANTLVGRPATSVGIRTLIAEAPPRDVSLGGTLMVTGEIAGDGQPNRVSSRSSTGRATDNAVSGESTRAGNSGAIATVTAATVTQSPCAVAPLDPTVQVIQPSNAQLVWAANRAVRGELTIARPANWQKHGLASYVPNTLFPRPGIQGYPGTHIPVQVLLGVMAQESNLNQASWHALAGVPASPLIANYYGISYSANGSIASMDYSKADCGYGVAQITTHMRSSDSTWAQSTKLAVATDYEVNIAAAVNFLESSWNSLKASGISVNGGDPSFVENWYDALWAYNTGIQPNGVYNPTGCTPGPNCTYNGSWGLGWTNNPVQGDYDPTRTGFLTRSYDDARYPYRWPYQERVLGWAEHAQQDLVAGGFKYVPSAPLAYPSNHGLFCTLANNCDPTNSATGYCLATDRTKCWWHSSVAWVSYGATENAGQYIAGQSEPSVTTPYPPACTAGGAALAQRTEVTQLPADAVVIDELPTTATNLAGCSTTSSAGSFALSFGIDSTSQPLARVDTHQLGVGYGGHIYFGHAIDPARTSMKVTGTWTLPNTVGWRHIWVFLPMNGATTHQADYVIWSGTSSYHRVVNQRWRKNVWLDLGMFQLTAGAKVSLSNVTYSDFAAGTVDVAWDALALTPAAKPVVSYVAFGDSYQSGEGGEPYDKDSDAPATNTPPSGLSDAQQDELSHKNACHRSTLAYPYLTFQRMINVSLSRSLSNTEFHFSACAGAVVDNVVGTKTHFSEVPQLKQGWLDENTTHVTIGIGGNDARFAAILKGCIMTIDDCVSPNYHLTVDGVVDANPLTVAEPAVIHGLASRFDAVLSEIRRLAPNAKILVVGYPHVVGSPVNPPPFTLYSSADMQFFRDMGDLLNGELRAAATRNGAGFLDLVPVYAGHEAYSWNALWINEVLPASSTGSGTATPGSGSFHPRPVGHAQAAAAITTSFLN